MAATTTLATMASKDSPILKNGLSLRVVLPSLRVLISQMALTRTLSVKSPLHTNRLSIETRLSPNELKRKTASAAELTLALIVGRLGTSFLSVLSRNLDVLRLLKEL